MRVWSPPTLPAISYETTVKRAAPSEISKLVRIPAGLWLSSRSRPTIPPRTAATRSHAEARYLSWPLTHRQQSDPYRVECDREAPGSRVKRPRSPPGAPSGPQAPESHLWEDQALGRL